MGSMQILLSIGAGVVLSIAINYFGGVVRALRIMSLVGRSMLGPKLRRL
jgi:hypothetical protein